MQLNNRKSDRAQLFSLVTQNLMLIPNLKSDFQKNLKKPIKIAETKKHDFCYVYSDRNFAPNLTKIFFSNSAPSNHSEKVVSNK